MENKNEPKKRLKFSRLCLSQPINAATLRTATQLPNPQISRFFSNPNACNDPLAPKDTIAKASKVNSNSDSNTKSCDKIERTKPEARDNESMNGTDCDAASVKKCDKRKAKTVHHSNKLISGDVKSTIKTFLSNEHNDSMADFETPPKVVKRAPKVQASKVVKSRSRRKQPDIRKALSKRDDKPQDYSHLPEDAQIELALAMSKAECNSNSNDDSSEPFSLESYEFKAKNAKGNCWEFFNIPKKANARFKWNTKCTQLTRRKDDVQREKIRNKVDELLLDNIIVESSHSNRPSSPEYFTVPEYTTCEEHTTGSIRSYYTNNLVELSNVPSGALLKDWSKIPGRDSIYDGIESSHNENDETGAVATSSQPMFIADDVEGTSDKCFDNTQSPMHIEEQEPPNDEVEQEREREHEQDQEHGQEHGQEHEHEHDEDERERLNLNKTISNQMEEQYDNQDSDSDSDADVTVVMDSDDIQLKVDAINSKIRLSQNFSDYIQPAVVTYESTSTVRAPSPDLFDDEDDDIVMNEEIQETIQKNSPNLPTDEDTVEAIPSSEVIEISSNEYDSNPVENYTQNIDSEEMANVDAVVETIDLLDSDSENMLTELRDSVINKSASCTPLNQHSSHDDHEFIKPIENVSGIQNSSTKSNGSPVKKLSFTERLELCERDMMNGFTDDVPEECYTQNFGHQSQELVLSQDLMQSQESIVLSDDEINYSMIKGAVHATDNDFDMEEDFYNRFLPSPLEFNLMEPSSSCNFDSDEKLVDKSVCNIFERTFEHGNSPVSAITKKKSIGAKTLKKVNSAMVLSSHYNTDVPSTSTSNMNRLKTPDKTYKMIDFDSAEKPNHSPIGQPEEPSTDLSNDEYYIRVGSVTPKPNYEDMDTAQLEAELRTFGLKPSLRRRQAIICLDYIYNRMHPLMEIGNESVENSQKLSRYTQPKGTSDNECNDPKINFNIGFATHNLVDEKFKQKNVEKIFLPSALRAKKPWCIVPLHIAWHNLIKANPELRKAVLLYEPINLIELKKFFKTIDMTFDNRDLISFLDLHCITFRMIKATKH